MKTEKERQWQDGLTLPQSSLPCRSSLLKYGKAWGELHFTAHSAKLSSAPLLHLTSICTMLTACPSVVLQGLYFLPCPTFIIPHIWCTLWTSCCRDSHTAAQPPFPNNIVASAPTSGPGTVFTETINYSWLSTISSMTVSLALQANHCNKLPAWSWFPSVGKCRLRCPRQHCSPGLPPHSPLDFTLLPHVLLIHHPFLHFALTSAPPAISIYPPQVMAI